MNVILTLVIRICKPYRIICLILTVPVDTNKFVFDLQLPDEQYVELAKDFKRLNYKDIIEQKVLEFIEENIDQLATYAHPKIIMSLLKGYETSHLFH